MKKIIPVNIILILLIVLSSYLASDNIFIALGVLLVYSCYFFLIFNRAYIKYKREIDCYYECFNFINDYIISLSNYGSLLGSFDAIKDNFSISLKKELEGVNDIDILEKIKYLQRYFPFHIYYLFCQIIDIYNQQGGNILDMSSYLIKQARSYQEHIDATNKYKNSKIVELLLLWASCILILIFIRFGLSQFFGLLKNEIIFLVCIVIFYVFLLIFLHISLMTLFKSDVRSFSKNEKN